MPKRPKVGLWWGRYEHVGVVLITFFLCRGSPWKRDVYLMCVSTLSVCAWGIVGGGDIIIVFWYMGGFCWCVRGLLWQEGAGADSGCCCFDMLVRLSLLQGSYYIERYFLILIWSRFNNNLQQNDVPCFEERSCLVGQSLQQCWTPWGQSRNDL